MKLCVPTACVIDLCHFPPSNGSNINLFITGCILKINGDNEKNYWKKKLNKLINNIRLMFEQVVRIRQNLFQIAYIIIFMSEKIIDA